jgi:hypothetical protein
MIPAKDQTVACLHLCGVEGGMDDVLQGNGPWMMWRKLGMTLLERD